MTEDQMRAMAEHWIAAWNRADLAAVLAPYTDDAVFVSPKAAEITGDALVRGRAALEAYWSEALARGRPRFTLDHVVCDVAARTLVVVYVGERNGERRRTCEVMRFDEAGRQIAGEALYGAFC
jgi:steroid delta-isomerase